MPGMFDIAREAGITHVVCPHCGRKFDAIAVVFEFFNQLLASVMEGKEVKVLGFGTFCVQKLKGRMMKTPLVAKGTKFKDTLILRFHQSVKVKQLLNQKEES